MSKYKLTPEDLEDGWDSGGPWDQLLHQLALQNMAIEEYAAKAMPTILDALNSETGHMRLSAAKTVIEVGGHAREAAPVLKQLLERDDLLDVERQVFSVAMMYAEGDTYEV